MQHFELVIFDLDGTLVDTAVDVHISLNLALEEMGLPHISMETAKLAIGPGPADFIKYVLGEANLSRKDEIRRLFRSIYRQRCTDHAQLFEGIGEVLETLQEANVKLAVATNKARASTDFILHALEIDSFFHRTITRNEVENPKPHPDMILKLCSDLEISPQKTMMVGDTDNDILAAQAAGVKSCVARWGYSHHMDQLIAMADYALSQPAELLECVENRVLQDA